MKVTSVERGAGGDFLLRSELFPQEERVFFFDADCGVAGSFHWAGATPLSGGELAAAVRRRYDTMDFRPEPSPGAGLFARA